MGSFSMGLDRDQLQVVEWVHNFAEGALRPAAREWNERAETPWPVIEEAARVGLYSFDFVASCLADPTGIVFPLVNEEVAWGDAGMAMALFGSALAAVGIVAAGVPEQVAEWVPKCFGDNGRVRLAALCASEPDTHGTWDELRTRAVYDARADAWTIRGTKAWIANGGTPGVHVVLASVEPELGAFGQASFVVPPGTPGLSVGRVLAEPGVAAASLAEVLLDDVKVPGACLLGGKDVFDERIALGREGNASGRSVSTATLEATSPLVAAQAVGVARAAYQHALACTPGPVKGRNRPGSGEAAALALDNMKAHVDAARLLYMRAAWMSMTGAPSTAGEGARSKLFASETATFVTAKAIEVLGDSRDESNGVLERWSSAAKAYGLFHT